MYGDSKNLSFFNSYNGWGYNEEYLGVIGFLEKKLKRSDMWQREELGKYMNKFLCEACSGTRLKKEALAVKINKKHIFDITKLSIDKALKWFRELEENLSEYQKIISSRIVKEIIDRLSFLNNVGLSYLQLSRSSTTLSRRLTPSPKTPSSKRARASRVVRWLLRHAGKTSWIRSKTFGQARPRQRKMRGLLSTP